MTLLAVKKQGIRIALQSYLPLWRASLLALGCVAAPKNLTTIALPIFVSAAHSSGSKLPRHRFLTDSRLS
ncbi:hypothetical protein F6R97_12365 [Pseudomonas sp. JV414]|nr:hypothetical protein [Pseudomonas sp. JV414]